LEVAFGSFWPILPTKSPLLLSSEKNPEGVGRLDAPVWAIPSTSTARGTRERGPPDSARRSPVLFLEGTREEVETVVKKRTTSDTQRLTARWEALVHPRGRVGEVWIVSD